MRRSAVEYWCRTEVARISCAISLAGVGCVLPIQAGASQAEIKPLIEHLDHYCAGVKSLELLIDVNVENRRAKGNVETFRRTILIQYDGKRAQGPAGETAATIGEILQVGVFLRELSNIPAKCKAEVDKFWAQHGSPK